jgi:hypothetical protein
MQIKQVVKGRSAYQTLHGVPRNLGLNSMVSIYRFSKFPVHSSMKKLCLLLLVLHPLLHTLAQEKTNLPKSYTVYKTQKPPKIDGKIGKDEWRNASWSAPYVDIADSIHPIPRLRTNCKMLWDDNYLYIAAKLEEPDLWATLKNHDDIVFQDNDFEVFIDPNNDGSQYFEIEINALGTVMDLFMFKTYKKGGPMDMGWNTTGMKSAVFLKGTLNKNDDRDQYWTIEMAIPFESMKRENRISHPQDGSTWRINFSRVQWQLEKSGLGYEKKKGPGGKRIPEDNWVWSPQGVIDMHVPEKWGFLHFKVKP